MLKPLAKLAGGFYLLYICSMDYVIIIAIIKLSNMTRQEKITLIIVLVSIAAMCVTGYLGAS